MRLFSVMLGLCALLAQGPASAEHPTDPLSWLGRISTAGQRLNYVGTFVYQSGSHVETSRIAHRVDANGETSGSRCSTAARARSSAAVRRCVACCPTNVR